MLLKNYKYSKISLLKYLFLGLNKYLSPFFINLENDL